MQEIKEKFTNKLINETSPYLLSHAHNPVNWNAWNNEALREAKTGNKLLIISIGYSACHWCHVMERESFEDEEVAQVMNKHFISIKVDREERPDIDQVYMNAAMLINGSGGWPLNAIALPDGRPIYAGTYFPKENWIKLLNQIITLWEKEPEKLIEQAEALTAGINKSEQVALNESDQDFLKENLEKITHSILGTIDFEFGGSSGQPKFPLPVGYEYLLDSYFYSKDKRTLDAVEITLKNMALGGIYDQIGGGFARYSVDKFWHAPHFEKMLYDNAQLINLYSKAYQITQNKLYKSIVYETIEFIKRELTSPEGGFYSALDADSEEEEGKFYVWNKKEVEELLGDDAQLICEYYSIVDQGNWEGKNILHPKFTTEEFTNKYSLNNSEFAAKLSEAKSILLFERSKRVRPALDDKILTSWNALTIKGLVKAYRVFDNPTFLELALNNAKFLLKHLIKDDGRIERNFKNGNSTINGYLDDYANLIESFIELYQATLDERWILTANKILEYCITHFLDKSNGMYFYTNDLDAELIARKTEINDNVMPGSNSTMAWNLYKMGKIIGDTKLVNASKQMVVNVYSALQKGNFYYANWSRLLINLIFGSYEVVIIGNEAQIFRKKLDKHFLPNITLAGGEKEGVLQITHNKYLDSKTNYYVCKNNSCKLPTNELSKLLEVLYYKNN